MPLDKPRPKTPKRVMEKKRRARINDSLTELKNLVLQALNRNNPRHSKLEKADILEMTVKYLRGVHGRHVSGKASMTSDPGVSSQYRSGFAECMMEVKKFLDNSEAGSTLRLHLLDHLSRSCGVSHSLPSSAAGNGTCLSRSNCLSSSDVNMTHTLPVFRLPTTLTQATSHSAPSSSLAVDSVQSVQTMQINSPPTLPVMNIQLPTLPKVPAPTLSLPTPSIPLQTSPFPPPPPPLPLVQAKEKTPVREVTQDDKTSDVKTDDAAKASKLQGDTGGSSEATQPPSNAMPLVMGRTQGGDVAVVLPQSALPGGKFPTHLIPVYQPNLPNASNVVGAVTNTSPTGPFNAQSLPETTTASCTIPISSVASSPRAGTVAPVTWYTRPALLTTNIEQGQPVFAQQGTPVTITLPIQARIVQNIIPIQAAAISPITPGSSGNSLNHIPIRMANPNLQNIEENEFMWRPW